MTALNDADLAAIALTSRVVAAEVEPYSAREFWKLYHEHEPSNLLGLSVDEIVAACATTVDRAERIVRLLQRATGLAIAIETLDHSGIWTVTGLGTNYPARLREHLRDDRPVVLHGVGELGLLSMDCVGIVGDAKLSTDAMRQTKHLAQQAARSARAVVSVMGDTVGRHAMNAAFEADGTVVGVPETPLEQVLSRPRIRKGVMSGRICLLSPDAPSTPLATSRVVIDRLIYGMSECTIVMACEDGRGTTWTGALDAIEHSYGRVFSWVGAGSSPGNRALADAGAQEFTDVAHLPDLLVGGATTTPTTQAPAATSDQLSLDFGLPS